MTKLSPNAKTAMAALFLAALIAVPFFSVLSGRKALFPGDILMAHDPWRASLKGELILRNGDQTDMVQIYMPYRIFVREQLKKGVVPLWNPHQMCGAPFMATGVSAVFYPLNFIFFQPLDPSYAIGAWSLFHLWLAGVGMLIFLRALRLGASASAVGATAWMFSGWFMMWMQTSNTLAASAWAGWIFALYEIGMRRRKSPALFLAAALVAVQTMAGMLQISLYTCLALAGWGFLRSFFPDRGARRLRPFAAAVLVAALGGAMAAFQLLPTMELSALSQRATLSFKQAMQFAVPFRNLPTLLMPLLFGSPANPGTLWKGHAYAQYCGYISIFALTPALMALFVPDARKRRFALIAAASLALAFPTGTYAFIYYLAPGAKALRYARLFFLWTFAMAPLAAICVEWTLSRLASLDDAKSRAVNAIVIQAVFLFAGMFILFSKSEHAFQNIKEGPSGPMSYSAYWFACSVGAAALACWMARRKTWRLAALLAILIAVDQWLVNGNFTTVERRDSVYPPTPATDYLKGVVGHDRIHGSGERWVLYPDTAMVYNLNDIRGYETLFPRSYRRYAQAVEEKHFGLPLQGLQTLELIGHRSPMVDLMGVKFILSATPLEDERASLIYKDDIYIYRNRDALDRARLVPMWHVEPDEEKTLAALAENRVDLKTRAVVPKNPINALSGEEVGRFEPPPGGEPFRSKVEWEKESPNEIRLKTQANFGGLLTLADVFYPGWKASVDGKPAEILKAYATFRAVYVPSGSHEVVWSFAPESLRRGFTVSGFALLLGLTLALSPSASGRSGPGSRRGAAR